MRSKALTIVGLAVLAATALSMQLMAGEETLADRHMRLEQMSDAEKTRLLQKTLERFMLCHSPPWWRTYLHQ